MLRLARLFVAAAALVGMAIAPALAAVTTTPAMLQAPKIGLQQFVQGTDAPNAYKTIYTGGTNGSRVVSLIAFSNDAAAAHSVICSISRSATVYTLISTTVPINAGTSVAPAVDILNGSQFVGLPLDADGNHYLYLQASDILECAYVTALTTGTQITLSAVGADF